MPNEEIKTAIKKKRLFQYEIADFLKISESSFSKLLRKELDTKKKEYILQTINNL